MMGFLAAILMLVIGLVVGAGVFYEVQRRDVFGLKTRVSDPVIAVINALIDGRLERAEALLVSLARVDKDNVPVNRALAAVYRRKGEFKKALNRDRTIAVRERLRPNVKAEAFYHLALDYLGLGSTRRALEALEEGLRLAPRNRRIARKLVAVLAESGDWERAYQVLSSRSKPHDPQEAARLAHFQVELGQQLLDGGEPRTARRHFRKAIEFHPDGYAARLLLGDAYIAADANDKAIAEWERLVANRPELFAALYPRFQDAFFHSGRFDDLGAFLRTHLSRNHDDPRGIVILARYLAKKQLFDDAIRELRAALKVDPGFIEAHRELGLLLIKQGRSAEALASYEQLLQELPGRTPAFRCRNCNMAHLELFWRCPECGAFESAVPAVAPTEDTPGEPPPSLRDRVVDLIGDAEPLPVRKVRPAN